MSYPTLWQGSKGKDVEKLQTILNQKLKNADRPYPSGDINVNGTFGSHTKAFVESFQVSAYLPKDGVVGPKTWAALLGTEMFNCYDDPIKLVATTSDYDCWAASTGTLLNATAPNPYEPPGVIFEQLPNNGGTGGIKNDHGNMKKFADGHGMQMIEGINLTCMQICYLVHNFGRLMINVRGITSRLKKSNNDDSHLMMITGLRGNGTPNGTTVRFYEPTGNDVVINSFQYQKNKFPQMTYQVFYMLNNFSAPVY